MAVTIQDAQARLPDLIYRLVPGEELVITENGRPVARIVSPSSESPLEPRKLGTMRGTVLDMAPDFDAPLEDFREYYSGNKEPHNSPTPLVPKLQLGNARSAEAPLRRTTGIPSSHHGFRGSTKQSFGNPAFPSRSLGTSFVWFFVAEVIHELRHLLDAHTIIRRTFIGRCTPRGRPTRPTPRPCVASVRGAIPPATAARPEEGHLGWVG